jgi:hypothetical protein
LGSFSLSSKFELILVFDTIILKYSEKIFRNMVTQHTRDTCMTTDTGEDVGKKCGRLEFKNVALFLDLHPCSTEREYWDEAWFIAANIQYVETLAELEQLGKLYSMVKNKGCIYDAAIMQRLQDLEKNMFV